MHKTLHYLFAFFLHLGGAGLFSLGVLDSSFLFMPLGNDLLLTALTINHPQKLPLYVLMAASGSCLGVFFLDLLARKGGEVTLQKIMRRRQLEYLKRKMASRAAIPVAIACLAPPPFPFTPVIATASAFNYPRPRLFGVVLAFRIVRFTIVGLLAIHFGHQLLSLTKTNWFLGIMIAIIALSIIGSVVSVRRWVRQSKKS